MFLKGNFKVVTERLDSLVTLADPLRAQLAGQIGEGELVREDAAADSVASFEDANLPTRPL
jgi:hypothetical protein